MSGLKVRVLLYDNEGNLLGEADVLTSADLVFFEDGDTFQQKYDKGELRGVRGAAGPQGPIGRTGEQGPQGPSGERGPKGDTGQAGPQGPRGLPGQDGDNGTKWFCGTDVTGTDDVVTEFPELEIYYTLGDMYLNTDTGAVYMYEANGEVTGWVYKGVIKGPPGEKGDTGAEGPKGETGDTGPQGPKGDAGATGPQGPAGAVGATGPQGAKGDKGDTGAKGATGAAGTRGSRWTTGTAITGTSTTAAVFSESGITDALVNDFYLNASTGYVYKCTTAGSASVAKWVYTGSIKGASGAKGATGATGAQGPKGDAGATGPQGPKGDSIKVGSAYATATEKNIYFKII